MRVADVVGSVGEGGQGAEAERTDGGGRQPLRAEILCRAKAPPVYGRRAVGSCSAKGRRLAGLRGTRGSTSAASSPSAWLPAR